MIRMNASLCKLEDQSTGTKSSWPNNDRHICRFGAFCFIQLKYVIS